MRPRRKRPKNDELLDLARIRERQWELQRIWLAAKDERLEAQRAAERLLAREHEDWARRMRQSGRGGEIYRGKPVEPRSPERVEAERLLAEAKDREQQALTRYHEEGEGTWEWRMGFRDFTAEDQRRLVKLRRWPTDRYRAAMRESPRDLEFVRWATEDLAAWEAARAAARTASPDPSTPAVAD